MAWHNLKKADQPTKREYLADQKQRRYIAEKVRDFENVFTNGVLPDVQYRLVTEKNFSSLVVLEYFLSRYEVKEMILAIYRMNLPAVNRLKEIVEQGIPTTILVSSFFRENKKYEKWTRELELFCDKNKNVELKFAWSHAKVFLCQTACKRFFVLEGSGNLSDNARIEQYLLEDNEQMYAFHKKWIYEVMDKR